MEFLVWKFCRPSLSIPSVWYSSSDNIISCCFAFLIFLCPISATMTERPDYDALAQDINLDEITSCVSNAILLQKIRDNDPSWSQRVYIMHIDDDDEEGLDGDFVVREGDDLGWLGYFIGRSEVIKYLDINNHFCPDGDDNYFFDGMSHNRSIEHLGIHCEIGLDSWISLGSFLENNRNLSNLEFHGIVIGHESAQYLASALGRMNHHSLEELSMDSTNISDEGLTDIVTALRTQWRLENLSFGGNNVGRSGCIALGNTLSRWPASNKLKTLSLGNSAINDGGLQALVSGMMNCCSLKQLYLGGNRSITTAGLGYLSPLLQSEAHSLEILSLHDINFGDDGAMILAEGLRGNKFLKELTFDVETAGITTIGWSAFSGLLCDTSTVNNTYLSHHTLTKIGCYYGQGDESVPDEIQRLLAMNRYQLFQFIQVAAICKILRSHPDLDMEPFFIMKMKFLPAIMSWFEKVEPVEVQLITWELINESERSCQRKKLSALYNFVRAMPDLTIIGYWEGRMIRIEAVRRRIADERRRLHDEMRRLHDEMRRLNDEERRLEYEEKFTLERLGDRPMDEVEVNRNKRMRHE